MKQQVYNHSIVLWAHNLHLLFCPVWPVYSIDVCLDRVASIPKKNLRAFESQRFAGDCQVNPGQISLDCSSLIFKGFPKRVVVQFCLTGVGVERLRLWCSVAWHVSYIGKCAKATVFSGKVSFAWGLGRLGRQWRRYRQS